MQELRNMEEDQGMGRRSNWKSFSKQKPRQSEVRLVNFQQCLYKMESRHTCRQGTMTSDPDAALHQEEKSVEEGRGTKLEKVQVEAFRMSHIGQ